MDYGKIHNSLFPTIQFHIITRNIDHNSIFISITIIIFPVSHPKFLIPDDRNQIPPASLPFSDRYWCYCI